MRAQVERSAGAVSVALTDRRSTPLQIEMLDVERIRPEEGLGRKRDRTGHEELCASIQQFGVITPITVREAPDGSGDFLLVKGQGRTLACRILGISTIPAIVVDAEFNEADKVQQFLVENVARLKMRPVDRALLIAHARRSGEETASVARRFGISAATVRRLESQLDRASSGELAALREGRISLSVHTVITRHVLPVERPDVVAVVASYSLRASEVAHLFKALGWTSLNQLGPDHRRARLVLFAWCCATLARSPSGPSRERLAALASELPMALDSRSLAAAR